MAETLRFGCLPIALTAQCGPSTFHLCCPSRPPALFFAIMLTTIFCGVVALSTDFTQGVCGLMAGETDKKSRWADFVRRAGYVAEAETNLIANMANLSAMLHDEFGFFWVGFYIVDSEKELVLGPFQGPPACTRIPFGKGVCGTAWKENRSVVVPDVSKFPGHIACSARSKSEIVVPVYSGDEIFAVLDIDSEELSTFDDTDREALEELVKNIKR